MTGARGANADPVAPSGALTIGARLGAYTLGQPLRNGDVEAVFRGTAANGAAVTLFVIHPKYSAVAAVREALFSRAPLKHLGEQKHLLRTLDIGETGGLLWVATEEQDGTSLAELLERKRAAGQAGFVARSAGNVVIGAAAGVAAAPLAHGALSHDSLIVGRNGLVRVADFALGAATIAAVAKGGMPAPTWLAPEASQTGATAATDVYCLGALLYEALLGQPLSRGGPRPSQAVVGLTEQVDELIARACHRDPDRRFGSVEVFRELVADALTRGGAIEDEKTPVPSGPVSAAVAAAARGPVSAARAVVVPVSAVDSGPVDPGLAAALADPHEHWVIAKGRMDYGPFSLAEVVAQIRSGEILADHVIRDKDTGDRSVVGEHPLLGPLAHKAKQDRDMARRAEAEVAHQGREKIRGTMLYGLIGLGVVAAALVVFFVVKAARSAEQTQIAGIEKVGEAKLDIKMSEPKRPSKNKAGGGRRSGGASRSGGGNQGSDVLALDMSGDDDESVAGLDMGIVYGVYSRHGGQLGGCLQKTGEGSAAIEIIIDGPSGRVNWVRVNGSTDGALQGCLGRVLRGMKFPANGARTRAEFDISL